MPSKLAEWLGLKNPWLKAESESGHLLQHGYNRALEDIGNEMSFNYFGNPDKTAIVIWDRDKQDWDLLEGSARCGPGYWGWITERNPTFRTSEGVLEVFDQTAMQIVAIEGMKKGFYG